MKFAFFFFLLLGVTTMAMAQNQISGKVTDASGEGLPGVTVLLKGTSTGTATGVDGSYSLSVPKTTGTLAFSFIGYTTAEKNFNKAGTLNVVLQLDTKALEEVVVIGYGTARKSDLTGAVASVKEEQLKERPASSLNQALAGRMPGVQVNTNSGRPGGRTNVRIRGFSSINSSNNPLYVIDGVMLPQSNMAQASSPIDYINPNDIVSVEVLKDASSTAIYGARGANGVILVTTKKGKSGDGQISYNVDFSVPTIGPNRPEVLNSREYFEVEEKAWRNMEKYDPVNWNKGAYAHLNPALKRADPALRELGVFDANGNPLHDTDWLKESTQSRLSQNHSLNFSGGNERTQYSLTLGARNEEGFVVNSFLKRYSGRFTLDDQIKPWLKVGGTLSYNDQLENLVDINDAVARQIVEDFPFMPVRYPNGIFANNRDYPFAEGSSSSVHRLHSVKYLLKTKTAIGSVYSNLSLAKGLEMRTVFGANILSQENDEAVTRTIDRGNLGYAAIRNSNESFWSLENYLTYNKEINENNSLTGMLGVSWQETNFTNMGTSANTFATDYFLYNNLGAGATRQQNNSFASRTAFNSYFGRFNYNLMDKYLLTFTGRADGSSRFGENHKFSFFPSAALAWRVSEESFLKGNPVVSNLKLRSSYGITGNSEIPAYSSQPLLGSNYLAVLGDARVVGTGLSRLANPDLRWEKTAQADIGMELGLLNNRISVEADVYYRKTTDMILDAPVPRTSGYASVRKNIGSMQNKGVELTLNTVNIEGNGFSWTTGFNVSANRNKILALATSADIFGVGGPNFTNPTNIIRIGEAAGSFWGLTRLGTWGTHEADEAAKFTSYRAGRTILPGDVKYLDVNGDYAITDADRSIIGNGSPDFYGSLVNTFRYKNFDFMVDLQYSYGNDVLDMTLHPSEDRQVLANSYKTVLNAWTPENQNTMVAEVRGTQAGYVTNVDSHWVKDGSFIRGRNLILGYTIPAGLSSKAHLNRLRVYASAQNLFLLVNDEVIGDPETVGIRGGDGQNVFSQGQNWHGYPKPRTFMFGLQVGL